MSGRSPVISRLAGSQTVRHGAIVFGGIVVSSLFNYLFYMLMGRRLGVEAYGVMTSLVSALLTVGTPATIGQLIAARLSADLEARGSRAALRRLADLVTIWSAAAGGVLAVAGLLAREPLATFFHLTDARPVVMTVLGLGIFAVVVVQRGVFQGAHRFGDLAASMSIEAVSKVMVALALVGTFGVSGALFGVAFSITASFCYNWYAFHRAFGTERAAVELERTTVVRVISHVGLAQLTITFLSFYDVPLVKHLFDARSAGFYAAASLVGRAVLSAVSFVPILVLPKVAARVAAGLSTLPLLLVGLGIGSGIVAVAALLGATVPRMIVSVIAGIAFGDAAPLILFYVLASGALALAGIVAAYRTGLHSYQFVWPALAVAVAEMVVLATWHPSLLAVVSVLALGHGMVLAVTLVGVNVAVSPEPLEEPVSAPLPEV